MPNIDLKIKDFHTNSENKNIDKLTNIDAEIAVIGCILWDNRSYEKISDFLNEDHFANNNNRNIYKIIKKLLNNNVLVTPVTLKNHNGFKEIAKKSVFTNIILRTRRKIRDESSFEKDLSVLTCFST